MFSLSLIWILSALLILIPVQLWLNGSLPLFTFVWLLPPLITLLVTKDSERVGIRRVAWKEFLPVCGLAMLGLFLATLALEPWSRTYIALVHLALASPTPDSTFAWALRFPGWPGLTGMFAYTALVSIFAEELFFRGWLLNWLRGRLPAVWAIALQALLFALPQGLAALFLSPIQAVVYFVGYSFLVVGCIGGWAAWRTRSIWPSLVAASLMNLVFVMIAT